MPPFSAQGKHPSLIRPPCEFTPPPRRCGQLTCNICSRTCTHLPPTQPPTPMLSYSPTPPCTPLPPLPLRLAVTFQSAASAVALRSPRVTSKQRKRREFDGGSNPNDNQHMMEDFLGDPTDDEMIIDGRGCGRKVCRNCSFENPQRFTPLICQVNSFADFYTANLQPVTIVTDVHCSLPPIAVYLPLSFTILGFGPLHHIASSLPILSLIT